MDEPTDTEPQAAFGGFGLDERIARAAREAGFTEPTPIQAAAIPVLLAGSDVIGRARTGSGKTAAFALPLLEKVKDGGAVRALVLVPTRELALQVTEALKGFARNLPLQTACVYGGASYETQFRALARGATVVVATPGRLIDLLDRDALNLRSTDVLVLDEADEMLRMGFIEDVERVLGELPETCQVCLFSATLPEAIQRVVDQHLPDAVEVQVESQALTVDHIEQWGVLVPQRRKLDALVRVLLGEPRGATLVFARTRAGCAEVADELAQRGVAVEALHGDLNQAARERVMHRLRAGRLDVVIATDVAARGLDVDHLTHVINFDMPGDTEGYVHRIGRTGRAGRRGVAISFVTPTERRKMRFLERDLRVVIEPMRIPDDAAIDRARREALRMRLEAALDDADVRQARAWLTDLTADGERSLEDFAAAAVALLAREQGAQLEAPQRPARPEPPPMRDTSGPAPERDVRPEREDRSERAERPPRDTAGPAPTREARPERVERAERVERTERVERPARERMDRSERPERGERPERPERSERPERRDSPDEPMVRVYVGTGSQWGTRPGDLVGALANETGISGSRIGKVVIELRRSFVDLPASEAERILRDFPALEIRGARCRLAPARDEDDGGGWDPAQRLRRQDGPPRGRPKPARGPRR